MACNERTLREYMLLNLDMVQESVTRSGIMGSNFEIKPAMIQMHLKWFLQLCHTFKYNGVTDDAIRLRLFPFSLIYNIHRHQDQSRHGTNSQENSYNEKEKFLCLNNKKEKFFMKH
ncbi:RING-H2 finger protein ATL63 [Gossypium australe]|uniref:RING-H2 finger protein ATL63 n=1 Tax=Gossypium australe TaxID=47621 RepID=A0A5B6VKA2_9ROSI|nr:RING-H2 finger protein ATL63 [Gossypium australe]